MRDTRDDLQRQLIANNWKSSLPSAIRLSRAIVGLAEVSQLSAWTSSSIVSLRSLAMITFLRIMQALVPVPMM